ncbi:MAG: phage integrase N-terminal SAM-like domain-containing protein [Draconibacterium sp.]
MSRISELPPKVPPNPLPSQSLAASIKEMAIKKKYKEPKIVRAKRGWFIALPYEYPDTPGKYKRFEISAGINYIRDLDEREQEAQSLLKEVKRALKAGFDPFFAGMEEQFAKSITKKIEGIERTEGVVPMWTISEGIKNFQEYCIRKNLSDNTIRTYNTFITNFSSWLNNNELDELIASEITENTIQGFLDESFDEEGWTPRTYNNHIRFFNTLFSRMSKLEHKENKEINYHIDLYDIEFKKDRAEKNRYYSPVVSKMVKRELKPMPELNQYVNWIYYSCMRTREIRLLQIKHIDLEARQIKAIGPTAKTGDRFVPICDELKDMILSMKLMDYPQNYYVLEEPESHQKKRLIRISFLSGISLLKKSLGLIVNIHYTASNILVLLIF